MKALNHYGLRKHPARMAGIGIKIPGLQVADKQPVNRAFCYTTEIILRMAIALVLLQA